RKRRRSGSPGSCTAATYFIDYFIGRRACHYGAQSGTIVALQNGASRWEAPMMRLWLASSLFLFAARAVLAQDGPACAAKAVGKDGKALSGAAKASSMKKCCEAGAVGKDGKKLAGAAKASFLKKCEAGS